MWKLNFVKSLKTSLFNEIFPFLSWQTWHTFYRRATLFGRHETRLIKIINFLLCVVIVLLHIYAPSIWRCRFLPFSRGFNISYWITMTWHDPFDSKWMSSNLNIFGFLENICAKYKKWTQRQKYLASQVLFFLFGVWSNSIQNKHWAAYHWSKPLTANKCNRLSCQIEEVCPLRVSIGLPQRVPAVVHVCERRIKQKP